MQTSKILQTTETAKMLTAAEKKATEIGCALSIAITDAGGHLLAFTRMDGTPALTANIAVKKAFTSAISATPTNAWMERAQANQALLSFPDIVSVQGGLPIMLDGVCIGAVGASGAAPEIDEAVAQAAVDALR